MPVHCDVANISQHLGRAVAALFKGEQFRRLVDEFGVVRIVEERRVFQQIFHKGDVGADATDTEFTQGAVHAGNRLFGGLRLGCDLDQQAVIIACDHPAGIGGAAVQTDAHARCLAKGGDTTIVGNKVVLRVFGRDAGLQGMAVQLHIGLGRFASRLCKGLALGDQDLRPHNINAGDFFGHGVFDLHTWIDLDEIEFVVFHIHEEFDGAGAFVIHMGADFAAQITNFGALFFGQIGGRRAFNDLLVAALDRTVTFKQVVNLAVFVAQNLHLDVAGLDDHLFKITLAIPKGRFGLAATLKDFFLKLFFGIDCPHATPAAAPRRLEHQRISHLGRLFAHQIHVVAQDFGGGNNRHACLDRDVTCAGFVAKRAHGFGTRADKGDAVLFTRVDKIGVLRQQAIARMDRIRARCFGHADDLVDA